MITAQLVKDLREKTGAGMMDCKKVLTETDGDMEKAIELLRERGIAKAAKKSSRVAAEGLVDAYVSEDGKVGAIVEVNSETDFVAKNAEFQEFVKEVAKIVAEKNPADVDALLEETYFFLCLCFLKSFKNSGHVSSASPIKTVSQYSKASSGNIVGWNPPITIVFFLVLYFRASS